MKNLPKAFKYSIWPGLMLVTAGVVVGVLNGWGTVAVVFLVVGLLLLVTGIFSGGYASGQFWNLRSTQASTNALVSVISVLLIIGLLNFVAARYDSRIDLTEGQVLSLSPASQEVVEGLENSTELLIFSPVPNPADQQLLDNYRRYNSDFTYRYIDPRSDPQLARQLGVETGGEVFLRSGDRTTLVQRVGPQEPLTERQLTDKLAQLSQNESAVAYFLQGHGEYAIDGSEPGLLEAATQLQQQNYTVAPLNLADTGRVPADADVLVIARPQEELFENEVTLIQDYLEGGGSVLALIDPQTETGLEALMSQWGVVLEDALVIDTSGGGQLVNLGPAAPLVQEYGDHPITEAFGNSRSFFPVARPLQISEVPEVQETPLLFTNQNSYAQPVAEGELAIDPEQAPQGPFALGVALSRPAVEAAQENSQTAEDAVELPVDADVEAEVTEGEDLTDPEASTEVLPTEASPSDASSAESRMVVIGNSTFATDGLFDQQLNGDVFLNSVDWLSKIDNPVLSIRPKEITNRRIEMTISQQIFLTVLALVIFPVVGLAGAGTLWAIRR